MTELPTQEELENLYHEKGQDALVWYAWRNALRALPSLRMLEGIDTIHSIYTVCRSSLVLAQWVNMSTVVIAAAKISTIAAATTARTFHTRWVTVKPANITGTSISNFYMHESTIDVDAANAAVSAYATAAATSAISAAYAATAAADATATADVAYARADYNFLKKIMGLHRFGGLVSRFGLEVA